MDTFLQLFGMGTFIGLGALALMKGRRSPKSLVNACEMQFFLLSVPGANWSVWTDSDRGAIAVCVIGNGVGAIYFSVTKVRHDAGCRRLANGLLGEYRWLASFLLLGLCFQAGALYCNRSPYLFAAEILTVAIGVPYAILAQRRHIRAQAPERD